jgi:asparagine synthase (glutamine-hydrolysing)
MNRIAGIFNLDRSPVHPAEIDGMTAAQTFSAGDKRESWVGGAVGLGCVHIGGQPQNERGPHAMTKDHDLVISFDGRIDNHKELLAILWPEPGCASLTDPQLVLAAYEKWGLDCPKHLLGDFAFAIWDGNKHRLVCARDRFGVKPFYYSHPNRSFVFASTPQAVLASGKVPLELNENRIADFLINELEGIDKVSSFYKGIRRLPAAHLLIVRPDGVSEKRYWELTPTLLDLKNEEEYLELFRELFAEAVRCCLSGAPAPGSMLSGGMDSSAIVGMARKVLAEDGLLRPPVFAAVSNDVGKNRETENILAVIEQGELQTYLISETEVLRRVDELVANIEAETEPFDCLMNLIRAIYLHAHDQGMDVILDGVQGDVLFSISGHLPHLWRQGSFRTIIEETFRAEGVIAEYRMGRGMFFHSFLSAFTPIAPGWYRSLRRPVRYHNALRAAPYVRRTIIDRQFAARARLGERFATLDSYNPRLDSFNYTELHKRVLDQPFITTGLERYERVAASFGIEPRHPFHDVRLVEFCIGLPWYLKTYRGWTKNILRRAMEPYLPPNVIWRKDKDSLMWEVNRLILKERAEYFYQITCDEQANLKPYVNLGKLMKAWHEYLTAGDEKHAEWLWSGVALAMWLRRQREMQIILQRKTL